MRIQAWVRGWIQLRRFSKLRQSVIEIQSLIRGWLARKEYTKLKLERAAVRIQARVRGYLARIHYYRDVTNITVTQNAVRRFFAKKKLKTLKMEAKTVSRQIELNKGLENKIFSLQQRLIETTEEIKAMKAHEEKVNDLTEELMMSKMTIEGLKKVSEKNENMERSIGDIKIELRMEKEANIQLLSEKLQLEKELVLIEEQHVRNIDIMRQEIEARLQEEKSILTAEIEQERRVYQELLMDYNSVKTETENLREELHSFR